MRKIIIMVIAIVMLFNVFAQAEALTLAAGLMLVRYLQTCNHKAFTVSTGGKVKRGKGAAGRDQQSKRASQAYCSLGETVEADGKEVSEIRLAH